VGATSFGLKPLPNPPVGQIPQVRRACRYLTATHGSVTGLLDSYNLVREERVKSQGHGAGRLSRDELDLLRAALIFTSSGLDACCQTLVTESLPSLIGLGGTARLLFERWLEAQVHQPIPAFVEALKDPDPRSAFMRLYIQSKTKASYQGTTDLKERVRDLLGIPKATIPDARIKALDGFFTARNDIVHRLDYVTPQGPSTKRHHRSPVDVVKECDRVLIVTSGLIHATAAELKSR
jgi:hypothetical protein